MERLVSPSAGDRKSPSPYWFVLDHIITGMCQELAMLRFSYTGPELPAAIGRIGETDVSFAPVFVWRRPGRCRVGTGSPTCRGHRKPLLDRNICIEPPLALGVAPAPRRSARP